jgi:hypothetical protein
VAMLQIMNIVSKYLRFRDVMNNVVIIFPFYRFVILS